ncbi:hypothetical protein M9H77_12863 [Catharanthus roseus]|uniref:Uncharacterized protein n=1 Tax=Catharanthus roseus TaxID=4058 RepID=A0ACC0BII9_CATRO|nr:hypothetical protein M9H77_12863 [Catharanthus roseus]
MKSGHLLVGNFLAKKVEDYLCSLNRDLFNKSIRRNVERCSYMISSFETHVIAFKGIDLFKYHFLHVIVQLENPCDDHKFLIRLEVVKAFLIENILGFQFYHFHFKESMIARLLWLFESTYSRMNPFKEGANGMTQDKHENIESFQRRVTRSRERKIEEETQSNKFRRV